MGIEVWKCRPFWGHRKLRDGLTAFCDEGRVYASWKRRPVIMRQSLRIPVSDHVAEQVLGAVREPCPYNGKSPVYRLWGAKGYIVRGASSGEDCVTRADCHECGYSGNVHDGSPRFNRWVAGEPCGDIHPERTLLRVDKEIASFTDADWDESKRALIPSSSDGRLIIWAKGGWSSKWAEKAFPDAELVFEGYAYMILRERLDS